MEHVLLALVRWQDAPSNESSGSFGGGPGSAASIGVPMRLKDWIWGYPVIPREPDTRSRKPDMLQPRRRARTMRIVSVTRNVRMYTPDLVKDCCKLGYSTSQRGDSCPECIRTISELGASGSTSAQADSAIRRRFQEAHGPSSYFPSTYRCRILQCVDRFLYYSTHTRR